MGSKNIIWRVSCFSSWIWQANLTDLGDSASDKTTGTCTQAKYSFSDIHKAKSYGKQDLKGMKN